MNARVDHAAAAIAILDAALADNARWVESRRQIRRTTIRRAHGAR